MTPLGIISALFALLLGLYFLLRSRSLSAGPRRGTAIRLPRRGYQALGVLWLAIAALQIVTMLA